MNIEKPKDDIWRKISLLYFYATEGMNEINVFRNLAFIVIPVYVALKFTNIIYGVVLLALCFPNLVIVGWTKINYMRKNIDYFTIEKATKYGKYGYDMQERMVELQEKILKELETLNKGKQ